jgi:hypothetical protein
MPQVWFKPESNFFSLGADRARQGSDGVAQPFLLPAALTGMGNPARSSAVLNRLEASSKPQPMLPASSVSS